MSTEEKQDCGPLALKSNLVLGPLVEAAGMVNVLNHGSGSCVYSEGCHGVTQEHLERFAALLVAASIAQERDRCRYPQCVENKDERCPRWLTGECEGPNVRSTSR